MVNLDSADHSLIMRNESSEVGNETQLASGIIHGALPTDMRFGEAQVISISVYSFLFVLSAVLNLHVLANLLRARRNVGLSRLNSLLLHLVLADLSVSCERMKCRFLFDDQSKRPSTRAILRPSCRTIPCTISCPKWFAIKFSTDLLDM
jgi:hypothetical protein